MTDDDALQDEIAYQMAKKSLRDTEATMRFLGVEPEREPMELHIGDLEPAMQTWIRAALLDQRVTCPDCGTVVRGISMAEHIIVWCEADIPRLIDILMKRGWSHPNHKQTPELLHSTK